MENKVLRQTIEEVLKGIKTPVTPRTVANRVMKRLKND